MIFYVFIIFVLLKINQKIKPKMDTSKTDLQYIPPQKRDIKVDDLKNALYVVKKTYGVEIAKNVERIFRLETNHFKSLQFQTCFSAGMEMHGDRYPYGWVSCYNLWQRNPETKPIGYTVMNDGTGNKRFLCFKNVLSGFLALAEFLSVHKNNPGRWYSLNKEFQNSYNNKINQIKTLYV